MTSFIKKINNKITNHRLLVTNFSYLAILQIFTLIFPFITYPYLIKTIGLEYNGVIVFGQSMSIYLSLIINFGFNTYGAKQVAIYKDNKEKLNIIISTIYTNKLIIWIIVLLCWILVISNVPFFKQHYWVYFWSFFITINELLFPVWLFQGLEKMKYITLVNISVRLLFVILVFFIVNSKSDYYYVSFLYALGAILSGIISSWIVFVILRFQYIIPTFTSIRLFFTEAFPLFISYVSIQIYANINKLLVGGFLGMSEVSIYDFSEKIISVLQTPMSIVQQTVFPKISRERNISFVNKTLRYVSILNIVLCASVLLLMPMIMNYMLGKVYESGIIVAIIMSFTLFISGINLFLGGCRLIPWGYSRQYSKVAISNSIFFICLVVLLYLFDFISLYSIVMLNLTTELFGLLFLYIYNKKLNLI